MKWALIYAGFDGRISRGPFWLANLILLAIYLLGLNLGASIFATPIFEEASWTEIVLVVLTAWPWTALTVKRLHDRNRPGWLAAVIWTPTALYYLGWITGLIGSDVTVGSYSQFELNGLGHGLSVAMILVFVWWLVDVGCLRGTQGPNVYGLDPLGEAADGQPGSARAGRVPRWVLWIGVPLGGLVAIVVGILIVLGVLGELGILPSNRVLTTATLQQADLEKLRAAGIVASDETVEYFYSDGLISILEAGYVLTDRRLVKYAEDLNGGQVVEAMDLSKIASVESICEESVLGYITHEAVSKDTATRLVLELPVLDKVDKIFVEALRARLE